MLHPRKPALKTVAKAFEGDVASSKSLVGTTTPGVPAKVRALLEVPISVHLEKVCGAKVRSCMLCQRVDPRVSFFEV